MKRESVYKGSCFILATKHAKSIAIAPSFRNILNVIVFEYLVDTDMLGTFSGEIERKESAIECARLKCELSLTDNAEYALASEGSFRPHPSIPFLPCNYEILYFIDRIRGFHLHLMHVTEKTNYQMKALDSLEALKEFANSAQFPSHALIIRPNDRAGSLLFKGIETESALEEAFKESIKYSSDNKAWVETDMRANYNPSRMEAIGELAAKMATRLVSHCPECDAPGWGCVLLEKGLCCEYCDQKTDMVAFEIYGCVLCNHKERRHRSDGLVIAEQMHCQWCNP